MQVTGRQRVLLLSPQQAFAGLYPYPVHHTYDTYSMVDLEALDPGLWPKFGQVRGRTAILQPGDVLFVPQYWWVGGWAGGHVRPCAEGTSCLKRESCLVCMQ